jgi:two-component system, chemotaxis family, response regulator Rcp1
VSRADHVHRPSQPYIAPLVPPDAVRDIPMDAMKTPVAPGSARMVEILLVDDDPGDVQLAIEAFDEGRLSNRLHIAEDGETAMYFLRRQGAYADAPRPDLILLDLNMPRKDGREVLADLKSEPALVNIPVAIVTGNDLEGEILKAYNLDVACYITKPIDVAKLMTAVCSIPHFQVTIMTTSAAS